jgi:hypothetical protein
LKIAARRWNYQLPFGVEYLPGTRNQYFTLTKRQNPNV